MHWLLQSPCLFHILKRECLDWQIFQKLPEFFSFNDQMTTSLPPFLTLFIFVIISCAFEAVVTPFLLKYHCSLQHWPLVQTSTCLVFSIDSNSKFSRNSTLIFENLIKLSMLVTSTLVSVYTFHLCPPHKCNDTTESWLTFLKLSKFYEMVY